MKVKFGNLTVNLTVTSSGSSGEILTGLRADMQLDKKVFSNCTDLEGFRFLRLHCLNFA